MLLASEFETKFGKFEEDILKYINIARSEPQAIIDVLTKSIHIFERKNEADSGSDDDEEREEIMETISFLRNHKTVVNLEYLKPLAISSQNQLQHILKTGEITHIGENYRNMSDRIGSAVKAKGSYAECFVMGQQIPETIVLSLLIDFGLEDKPNRKILMDNCFKSVGVAFIKDFQNTPLCVLHFFGDTKSKLNTIFMDNPLDEAPWWVN